ncbi:MAG: hypothetical protein A2W25_05170 [candidate division Zixibacteria bacterium RBG_16_53_22]|nr:MAG: hypothetical protein A2W25_05170 [candidate division Zixibacteria bacterium RBG_16_53_22]
MSVKWAGAAGIETTSAVAGREISSVSGTVDIETSLVRDSGKAYRFTPGTTKQIQHNSYSAGQGIHYYRVYLRLVTAPAGQRAWVSIDNSSALKIGVRLGTDRTLQLYNEEDLANIGSASSAINTGEYYRLELKVDSTTLASTVVEARLYAASAEGTLLWNPSGTVNMSVDPNRLSITNRNDANLDFIATDLVIIRDDGTAPNSWAEQGSLVYLRPDGVSGTPQWTRGGTDTGANWSQLTETPPDGVTTYVTSNTSGQIDDYTMAATPAAVGSSDVINWLAIGTWFAISSASGADPDFVTRITYGGNTDESGNLSTQSGGTGYKAYQTGPPLLVFPQVSVDLPGASTTAWTKAALDAVVVGIRESATDTNLVRVSAVWLIFDHKPAINTLVIDDASHAHTAESPALTQHNVLAVQDGAHAHTAETIALVQHNILGIDDAAHGHTAENPTLTAHEASTSLTVQDASHSHTADSLALTQHNILSIQDGAHAHTAETPALTQHNILSIADATHGHQAENISLTQHNVLSIADASHGHQADDLALTQHNVLSIADAAHTHGADALALTQHNVLSLADATHGHQAENVTLTAHEPSGTVLTIADASHGHTAETISLTQHNVLTIADASHAHSADGISLVQHHVLTITDASHSHQAENISLTAHLPGGQGEHKMTMIGIFEGIAIGMET